MQNIAVRLAALTLLLQPMAAMAQNGAVAGPPDNRRAQQVIDSTRRPTAVDANGCVRNPRNRDEIVVCGPGDEGQEHRLPLRDQLDSARSTDDGLPRAPDVSGLPKCPVCIGMGWAPEPVIPYTADQLPFVDPEVLEKERQAEARARAQQGQVTPP